MAQLCKRITFSDLRAMSVDENETYVMRDAVGKLASVLASVGYAPR